MLGSEEIALYSSCVPERGPGEAAELVDPALLEEVAVRNPVGYVDRKIGEVNSLGWLLRSRLAALADQQLAEAPTREAPVAVDAIEAFLHVECEKLLQEPGRFGTGSGESGVDEPEDRGECVGLVQLEQPASGLPAAGTDGEQVEELRVLLRRPVCGEQVLQVGGIEVLVLHATLL
jgi:hypothetical protein